jgi:hypothetical protein
MLLVIVVIIFIFNFEPSKIIFEKLHSYEKFCIKYTSFLYIENNCVCLHPTFLTNNYPNNNGNKIVDSNCKEILNVDGKHMNFNTRDPYIEGVCDCGKHYYYEVTTRKYL